MKRLLLFISLIMLTANMLGCSKKTEKTIAVLLTEGQGYKIESQNPVHIKPGENANFNVTLDEGYSVVQIIGGDTVFKDGVLSAENVKFPLTLKLIVEKSTSRNTTTLKSNNSDGTFAHNSTDNPTSSSVKSSTKSSKPSTKSSTITTEPDEDQNLADDERLITYYANGGAVVGTSDSFYKQYSRVNIYQMPNSLANMNCFARDGYLLTEYNTSPDGKGQSYGLGHPILIPKGRKSVKLYCIWAKYTDKKQFSYAADGVGLKITKYTGNSNTVVIPEEIDGKSVVRISGLAFKSKGLKTLVLPSTINTVEKSAFENCSSLSKLYMFDSVNQIYDDSFSGTTKIKTLFLNAAIPPRFTESDESFKRNWERLITNSDKNRIIVVSGSSKFFGLDTVQLQNHLKNKYFVVNYGTHGWSNIMFYLDAISKVAHKGDIIVYAPEQIDTVTGGNEITDLNFHGIESCYDLLKYVDISKYTKIFSAFTKYNGIRQNMVELSYDDYADGTNEYGERGYDLRYYNNDSYCSLANGTFYFKKGVIPIANMKRLNVVFETIKKSGATPCMSFPPFNINAVDKSNRNDSSYEAYMNDIKTNIKIPMISDVRNYIVSGKYFHNTDYHLNDYGREVHTAQLGKDLAIFLNIK